MAEASPPSQPECRICKSDVDPENTDQDSQLVSPCGCTGSMQFVHESCLKDLIDVTKSDLCDFCSQKYNLPLLVVGYMTYNEWVKGDPRRVLILTGIVVVSAVLTLVGSLLFSWLTMFSILKRVIATGSLPHPLSEFCCGPSQVYATFVTCCGSVVVASALVHWYQFTTWRRDHGAMYELVMRTTP